MLSAGTCSRVIGRIVLDRAFGIIAGNTFPLRFNKPDIGTLLAAARPLLQQINQSVVLAASHSTGSATYRPFAKATPRRLL
jgi:hypothetical protein